MVWCRSKAKKAGMNPKVNPQCMGRERGLQTPRWVNRLCQEGEGSGGGGRSNEILNTNPFHKYLPWVFRLLLSSGCGGGGDHVTIHYLRKGDEMIKTFTTQLGNILGPNVVFNLLCTMRGHWIKNKNHSQVRYNMIFLRPTFPIRRRRMGGKNLITSWEECWFLR